MINYKSLLGRTDLRELEHRDYGDYKRILELYDKWDCAAKSKDIHNAEHYDWEIRKIFARNGLQEK